MNLLDYQYFRNEETAQCNNWRGCEDGAQYQTQRNKTNPNSKCMHEREVLIADKDLNNTEKFHVIPVMLNYWEERGSNLHTTRTVGEGKGHAISYGSCWQLIGLE